MSLRRMNASKKIDEVERKAHMNIINFNYLLFYKWILVNITGCSFFAAAYMSGWVNTVVESDTTGITWIIFVLFVFGSILSGLKTWKISQEINFVKSGHKNGHGAYFNKLYKSSKRKESLVEALKLRFFAKTLYIRYIANSLVLLGLIGTVVGFIIAMEGVTPEAAGNIDALGGTISALTHGMGVALYTTLVGAIGNLWLTFNQTLLTRGIAILVSEIIERE